MRACIHAYAPTYVHIVKPKFKLHKVPIVQHFVILTRHLLRQLLWQMLSETLSYAYDLHTLDKASSFKKAGLFSRPEDLFFRRDDTCSWNSAKSVLSLSPEMHTTTGLLPKKIYLFIMKFPNYLVIYLFKISKSESTSQHMNNLMTVERVKSADSNPKSLDSRSSMLQKTSPCHPINHLGIFYPTSSSFVHCTIHRFPPHLPATCHHSKYIREHL